MENRTQFLIDQSIKVEEPSDEQLSVEGEPTDQIKQEEPDVKPTRIPVPAVQIVTPTHIPTSKFLFPVRRCQPSPAQDRWKVPPAQYRTKVVEFIDPNVPIGVLLRKGYKFETRRTNPPATGAVGVQQQELEIYKQYSDVHRQHKFLSPSQPGSSTPSAPAHNRYDGKFPTILYKKRDKDSEASIPPPNTLIGEDPSVDVMDLEISQALKKNNADGFLHPVKATPRIIVRKRIYAAEKKQVPAPSVVPPAKKMSIKETLENVGKECARKHVNDFQVQSLYGSCRHVVVQNFPQDMHPSPKTLLEISEQTGSTYQVVFRNYQCLRAHHGVRCETGDNCERISSYFKSKPSNEFKTRLRADEQCLLDRTLEEFCEKNNKMTTGQLHVFADQIRLSPHTIKTRFTSLRKEYVQNLQRTDEEREIEQRQLMFQFTTNPFPDPAKYAVIAMEFKMKYEQVQRFFNSERLKHVKLYGPYQKVQLPIDEQASETLWGVVRQKKHINIQVRKELSKKLKISYKTVSFWVDKFASELRYGVEDV